MKNKKNKRGVSDGNINMVQLIQISVNRVKVYICVPFSLHLRRSRLDVNFKYVYPAPFVSEDGLP